jgi:hypothetical protein
MLYRNKATLVAIQHHRGQKSTMLVEQRTLSKNVFSVQ